MKKKNTRFRVAMAEFSRSEYEGDTLDYSFPYFVYFPYVTLMVD